MEISSNIWKKLRFRCSYSSPNYFYSLFFTSQSLPINTSSKTLFYTLNPTSPSSSTQNSNLNRFLYSFQSSLLPVSSPTPSSSSQHFNHRRFCNRSSSLRSSRRASKHKTENSSKPEVNWEKVREVIGMIKGDDDDMEMKLNQINVSISFGLVEEIFGNLNSLRVSGLRFFLWIRKKEEIDFIRSSDFCSLVVDNLGRIREFDLMLLLFKDFSKEQLCLTEKAFEFLKLDLDCLSRVVKMLKEVKGSCYNSGILALIKMLCVCGDFDLAKFVMEETERRTSYYNVLIWVKCGYINFEEAHGLLDEMRRFGCQPDTNSYSYLLGNFCKNGKIVDACKLLEEMEKFGFPLDATTFEMVINRACRLGRLDFAIEFLNQMTSRGIEPRYTTHAIVIKGYFYCSRFQEAYKYVVDMGEKYKCSANVNYSLLAILLQRSRRVIEAREILVHMMEKGIKPHFPVYMKVLKDLYKSGRGSLVADLKSRFSKFQ